MVFSTFCCKEFLPEMFAAQRAPPSLLCTTPSGECSPASRPSRASGVRSKVRGFFLSCSEGGDAEMRQGTSVDLISATGETHVGSNGQE
jgi:hypothetical protein